MPTSMTVTAGRDAITKPQGSDVISLTAINNMVNAVANRSEWNKASMIVASTKSLNMGGNDYPDTTSYAVVQDTTPVQATFTLTLAIGDVVTLSSNGSISFNGAVNSSYQLQWWDGSALITEIDLNKAGSWTVGETRAFSLGATYVATSAGSKTFSLRGKRTGSSATPQGGTLQVACMHFKIGAA